MGELAGLKQKGKWKLKRFDLGITNPIHLDSGLQIPNSRGPLWNTDFLYRNGERKSI